MKKIFFATTLMSMVILFSCKNNTADSTRNNSSDLKKETTSTVSAKLSFSSASEYNDYIVNRQKSIYDYIFRISTAAKTGPEEAEKIINEAVPAIEKIISEIKALPPYNGDENFRNTAISLYEFYLTSFDKSYREIIAINKLGNKKTKADKARQLQLSNDLTAAERGLDIAMKSAQRTFATANNMLVEDNKELQEKVDNLSNN